MDWDFERFYGQTIVNDPSSFTMLSTCSYSILCSADLLGSLANFAVLLSSGNLTDRNTAFFFGTQFASLLTGRGGMLKVNMDSVGEAAIVECEGTISGGDEALQLYDAVTGRAADRVIVIDLSRVSVTVGKGLGMLLFLERWARHRGIQLKLFNPRPSVRRDLGDAASPYELEFVSLGEVMAVLIDAANRQTLAA